MVALIDRIVNAANLMLSRSDREGKDIEDDEDDYYASFFNLDLSHHMVYWNEKDCDYREPLTPVLCGRGA